jgi:small-conductance mechanosensitive channel
MEKITVFTENVNPLLADLIIIIGSIILGLLIRFLISRSVRLYNQRHPSVLLTSIIRHLHKPAQLLFPMLILSFTASLLYLEEGIAHAYKLVVRIGVIIAIAWLLNQTLNVFKDVIVNQYKITDGDNLENRKIRTQLQYIRQTSIVIIGLIAIAAILLNFESVRNIGAGLLTSAGVAGIIIGFAAQKTIANLLAGFQIAFTQPIRYDDVVIVEGEWGKIEEITLTYVVVRIWDLRRLIVPINYFIEKPFQNWTRSSAEILGTVFLYVDYNIPVEEIRKKLTQILASNNLWNKKVNALQVTNTDNKVMELRALMSANDASDAFDLRCAVREQLVQFVQENYPESLPKIRAEMEKKENS